GILAACRARDIPVPTEASLAGPARRALPEHVQRWIDQGDDDESEEGGCWSTGISRDSFPAARWGGSSAPFSGSTAGGAGGGGGTRSYARGARDMRRPLRGHRRHVARPRAGGLYRALASREGALL